MEELIAEIDQLNEIWTTEEDYFLEKLDLTMETLNSNQEVLPSDVERHLAGLDERWKSLHAHLSKFCKSFEKKTKGDLVDIIKEEDGDDDEPVEDLPTKKAIDEALLQHFYREGNFAVADALVEELGDPTVTSRGVKWRVPFERMHQLMESLHQHDIKPALNWIKEVEDKLGIEKANVLKFKLHALAYLDIIRDGHITLARQYAQENFYQFIKIFEEDVNTLLGMLAFIHNLPQSPYQSLLSPDLWVETGETLVSAYCSVQGLPHQSALYLAVTIGLRAWPKVSRVLSLMRQQPGVEWDQQDELPVEIPLPPEFRFHSIFVCPVLRQQATEENPPMMLPCGHAICQEALMRLCKGNMNYRFKCPYCPAECTANNALKLKLQ